jgi:hypothetical protein
MMILAVELDGNLSVPLLKLPPRVNTPVFAMLKVVVLAMEISPLTVRLPFKVSVAVLAVPKDIEAAETVSVEDIVGELVNVVYPI